MPRFTRQFRNHFPNRVASHFDKYIEYTNPVPFDPIEDIYKQAFSGDEWDALETLRESKLGRECLDLNTSFNLALPGNKGKSLYYRTYLTFRFADHRRRPSLDVEYDDLPPKCKEKIEPWLRRVIPFRRLRSELFQRTRALLDFGWERAQSYDNSRDCWRGGPTPGMGCNTVGQVNRIWPELIAFFPADEIAELRNASAASRLPAFLKGYPRGGQSLTPEQFMCKAPWYHDHDETKPYSEKEMEIERRKLAALNHILTQMSLMKDVGRVDNYPDISLASL